MTYKEANNISIKDYLNSLGIQPVTENGSYGMYRSPLREDNINRKLKMQPEINLKNFIRMEFNTYKIV